MIINTFLEDRDKFHTVRVPFDEMGNNLEEGVSRQVIKLGEQTGHQLWTLYQLTIEWEDMVIEMVLEKLTEAEFNNRMYALELK